MFVDVYFSVRKVVIVLISFEKKFLLFFLNKIWFIVFILFFLLYFVKGRGSRRELVNIFYCYLKLMG